MNKKIISLFVAIGLAVSMTSTVFASPSSLQSQKAQLQKDKQALKQVQDKRQQISSNIEMLDNQIEDTMRKIDSTDKQIQSVQNDIKAAEADIQTSEDNIKSEKELFSQRVRAMYISGTSGYLGALLQAKGFSDFISRIEAVAKIAELDKKVVGELKSNQDEINKKKTALTNESAKLSALKKDNEQKLVSLGKAKDDQGKLVKELQVQEAAFSSKVDASQALVNASLKQIQEIRKNAPKTNLSRGTTSAPVTSNNIIAYASNFLGRPYLWGGTGPDRFDCSGFTQYVYAHFGIHIGRTTYDQINDGSYVNRGDLQPGDLVLFGTSGDPHHVGIYVGNGTYIHSPQTGDVIKISSLDGRSDFICGRRIQ